MRGVGGKTKKFVTTLTELAKGFKDFKIDSIELSLEGGVTTGKIIDLIVSAEGKGGVKLTLKPKS